MFGGTNVKMSGPCFTANDNIVVQLGNDVNINAIFSDELTSSVTIPVLNKTGLLSHSSYLLTAEIHSITMECTHQVRYQLHSF